jgi:hypothetical protein
VGNITATAIDKNIRFKSLFSRYIQINNPALNDFINTIPSDINSAINKLNEISTPTIDNNIFKNRNHLKNAIYSFHKKAGTLTNKVSSQLELINEKKIKIIVSIHQPNLFAFSGVFKKIVLSEILSDHMDNSKGYPVPLFLIVDHDFMDDSWVHVAKLPSIRNSSGILDIRYPMNEYKRWKLICNTEPPTHSLVKYWENQIYSWVKNDKSLSNNQRKKLLSNLDQFWNIVEESLSISNSYSDFNSIIMSRLINETWNNKTLFVNLSDLSHAFNHGYNFLLSNNETYLNSLGNSEMFFKRHGILKGISSNSGKYSPLWINCSCGSKGYSIINKKTNGDVELTGKCISCKRKLTLDIGKNNLIDIPKESLNKVSPRAIPILLLLSRELRISGYITGTGGSLGYTIIGKNVFDDLGIKLPALLLWPSKDVYEGFAQREALNLVVENKIKNIAQYLVDSKEKIIEYQNKIKPLISRRKEIHEDNEKLSVLLNDLLCNKNEQRILKNKIKIAEKSNNALTLKPCIIDYIVNFGMENISKQWSNSLIKNNDFTAPIIMKPEYDGTN